MKKYNAVVGQSGGPTAAINATLAGVIKGAVASGCIGTLYGMRNGVQGLMKEDLLDLTGIFSDGEGGCHDDKIRLLCQTPAAGLGSCRKKLPKPDEDPGFFEDLISIFRKYDIKYFFYIGGNDSMDTVYKLSEYLKSSDYDMYCVGVPKTIDNDLAGTDHTPGFGSAAKYIAVTLQEMVRDCSVYKLPAVTIVEIMGRDSGWLTASAGVLSRISGSPVDLIYLPEKDFDNDKFISDVKAKLETKDAVVVAVSEGIRYKDGHYVGEGSQTGVTDVFGHKYLAGTAKELELLVRNRIGCKVRSVELNICQRCAAHVSSKTDITESVMIGEKAVEAAEAGQTGIMISVVREPGTDYRVRIEASAISSVANLIKTVPDDYINDECNYVTDKCIDYILPLIQGENTITYTNGIPDHMIL